MSSPSDFPTGAYDAADPTRTFLLGDGPPPATAADDRPPAPPGYEIVRELGRGGMGVVYLARNLALGQEVALKVLLVGGHASAADRDRFLAEATTMGRLQHPGVVPVHQVGEYDGRLFMAMKYVPGGTLAQKLAGTPLPPREAAAAVAALARAVDYAHREGVVHRDIKPGNVLVGKYGEVQLTDFGLARRAGSDSNLTATGAVLGSPSYMAPEQAAGDAKRVGPAADTYGLGAVLYECLTGRPPFRAATAIETITQVLNADPAPPRVVVPGLPRDLETITLKCLQKDPARRYASAAALADDLGRFLDGRPIAARPVPPYERAWRWVRRHPAAAATAGVVLAAVGAVVGVLAAANASLQRERDAADRARAEAVLKGEEADRERARAQARLGTAVDAVERMMVRTAGEGWARNPAVQAERRAVLEEAVGFFAGLTGDDARDPLVRRRQAQAQFRIGLAHMALADYDRAAAALDAARDLFDGLRADAPDDPEAGFGLARALGYRGHVHLIRAEFPEAQRCYERMADLTKAAALARPDHEPYRVARVEALTYLGSFRANVPGAAGGGALFDEAVAEARALAAGPNPSYQARLYLAVALINTGGQFTGPAAARAVLAEVEPLLAGLAKEKAPSAMDADTYDLCRSRVYLLKGTIRTAAGDRGGLDDYDAGLAAVDLVLAAQPRMFTALIQRFNLLAQKAEALRRFGPLDQARAAAAAAIAHADGMVRDDPKLGWMRGRVAGLRADLLARKAQAGDFAGLDAEAAGLAGAPDGGVRYNVACALSLGSRHGPPADQERRAAEAVKLLTALLDGNFYRGPTNAAHVDKDTDLDPVRGRDDFKAFRAKLAALPPPKKP